MRYGIRDTEGGFSLVELMTVVLIVGILVAVAVPLYLSTQVEAARRTCLSTQRTLEGAVGQWAAQDETRDVADLAGTIDIDHPLVADSLVKGVPTCQAAPQPADSAHPTAAEGAYVLDDHGDLDPCPFGVFTAHGHY